MSCLVRGNLFVLITSLDESWGYIGILMSVRHTFGFRIIIKVSLNQIFSNFHTWLCTIKYRLSLITVYFTFTALFLLENRDFLGFQMIFNVWLNQIFSNFNIMLWTIKYRLSLTKSYMFHSFHCLIQNLECGNFL